MISLGCKNKKGGDNRRRRRSANIAVRPARNNAREQADQAGEAAHRRLALAPGGAPGGVGPVAVTAAEQAGLFDRHQGILEIALKCLQK